MKNIMTPENPLWDEFCARLEGPEGCDFRKDEQGELHWKCAGGSDKTFAIRILRKMGLREREIAQSLSFFEEHDGFCDCEILFNVDRPEEPEGGEAVN